MSTHDLIVALGDARYRVERPFGAWPANAGFVSDVAVDGRGHVFVLLRHDCLTQPEDPRVIELDPDGRYLGGWGGDAIADGHMMTVDAEGRVIVVDRDMHEVIWFSPAGERLGQLGLRGQPLAPFNHPTDVSVSPWGDIYVADGYAASHVHRFSADGQHMATWGALGFAPGEFGEPHGIWAFADGRVVVIDRTRDRVQVFDRDGQVLDIWTGFYRPVAIWGDPPGRAFVTDQGPSLHLIGADGVRIGRARPMLNGAHGIFGTPAGDLFLAESSPSRITRLRPIGSGQA